MKPNLFVTFVCKNMIHLSQTFVLKLLKPDHKSHISYKDEVVTLILKKMPEPSYGICYFFMFWTESCPDLILHAAVRQDHKKLFRRNRLLF